MRPRPALFTLMFAVLPGVTAGCEGHGRYTQEFLDQATEDRARLRSATQYDLAVQQFQTGDLERALVTVDGSIALNDHAPKAYLLRGRVLLELGRTEAAVASLATGLGMDPGEPQFHYYRGIAFERVGRLEEALADYLMAAARNPTNAQYTVAAAEVFIELERLDEARELLAGQEGDAASDPGVRQALGHVHLLRGDHDEAIRSFTEAAVLAPDDPVFREDLCHAQVAARRFAEAEATLRGLADEPGYADRHDLQHLHASCLIALDRPVEARRVLYRLVRSADGANDLDAWIKLIDVSLMLRDDGMLRAVANRLMAAAPGRHEGYLALAVWQRHNDEPDAALRSLDRAIARAGDDPTPRRLRAIIESEMRRTAG
jgi:tetratricopeptide (TPR) repeat protein